MSPELIAWALMVEEPTLPPDVALDIVRGGFAGELDRLPPVEPVELLRLAMVGYSLEQQ